MLSKIINPIKRASLLYSRSLAGFAQKQESPKPAFVPPNPRINPNTRKLRYFYEDPHNDTTSFERDPRFLKVMKAYDSFHTHAKKVRQVYLDSGYPPSQPTIVEPLRLRQPQDTLENLRKKHEVACVIRARDEFQEDIYFVLPSRRAYRMRKDKWYNTRQYEVKLGRETIRCSVMNLIIHPLENWPYRIEFQRYIPGRPNLLTLQISLVNLNQTADYKLGAELETYLEEVKVWCYNDIYPTRLEIDMYKVSCERAYKIGDLQGDMPQGMFLHRCYDRRKHEPIAKLLKTPAYEQKIKKETDDLPKSKVEDSEEEEEKKEEDEEEPRLIGGDDLEEQVATFEMEMKSHVNWEETTTLSKEALRTQPIQQLVEEDVQQDDLDPQEFYAFKDHLLRKLGVRKDYAEKKDYPIFVKPTKVLVAEKKKLDQEIQEQLAAQSRPAGTRNKINKKLHGKSHRKKLFRERQKQIEEAGGIKERNLLEATKKTIMAQQLKREKEEEQKQLLEEEQKEKELLQVEMKKAAALQKLQDEMLKAREEAEKRGYDMREYGFEVLRKRMTEEVEQKTEKGKEEEKDDSNDK